VADKSQDGCQHFQKSYNPIELPAQTMKKQNELALIIAFYMSKYDKSACHNLGYRNFTEACRNIGSNLDVKPSTLRNMRDEFDSVNETIRAGWYQRPLRPSRLAVAQAFDAMTEATLGDLVKEIISDPNSVLSKSIYQVVQTITGLHATDAKNERPFVSRFPTGRRAEGFFQEAFIGNRTPFKGNLFDERDLGRGYDFRIVSDAVEKFIEVKGVLSSKGAVGFTDKEWRLAQEKTSEYIAAIVYDIQSEPKIKYISDPANQLTSRKYISPSIEVAWNTSSIDWQAAAYRL
jgi:hypothetical protein